MDWPRLGESGDPFDSAFHADTGILWEIDTSTLQIVDQGITGALPETIFCTDSSSLLVSAHQHHRLNWSSTSMVDIILRQRGLPRTSQIRCAWPGSSPYTWDFLPWSDEAPLVAMCCGIDPSMNDPDYMAGLWIIDTDLAQVVNRLTITYNGRSLGVMHACISQVISGSVYVVPWLATTVQLYVIDKDTGVVTGTIPLPSGFNAEFVYEISDGRLIVTGGESGKILIIDPT